MGQVNGDRIQADDNEWENPPTDMPNINDEVKQRQEQQAETSSNKDE